METISTQFLYTMKRRTTNPLTFAEVGTPTLPMTLAIFVLLEAKLLDANVAVTEAVDQTLPIAASVRRVS
jgi:hypothetical protein